jgi:NTE family protein
VSTDRPRSINLALQGGGAHGAFTWGVLDRLLADSRLRIEGISGTSAGALNAAVVADGLNRGGTEGARAALRRFWRTMSLYGSLSPYRAATSGPMAQWAAPMHAWLDFFTQSVSPYQSNPVNINPLRTVLASTLDFDSLRGCTSIKLYVSATNVRTNHLRIFTNTGIDVDVLLASACLPHIHHAVEIEGEYYWDGGFLGNPVLEPLVQDCVSSDIVIVQINPMQRDEVPRTAAAIVDRVNEITFNSSLMREIRVIAQINRLIDEGLIHDPRFTSTWFHVIQDQERMSRFGMRSKYDTDWRFLLRLHEYGHEAAERWLEENFEHLGQRSTLDLAAWEPTYPWPGARR